MKLEFIIRSNEYHVTCFVSVTINFNFADLDETDKCDNTSTPAGTPKARKSLQFDVKHDLTPESKSQGLPTTKCRKVAQGNLYVSHLK